MTPALSVLVEYVALKCLIDHPRRVMTSGSCDRASLT